MIKRKLYILASLLILSAAKVIAQPIAIPDTAFLNFLKISYPSTVDENGYLIPENAANTFGYFNCSEKGIENLEGIQYFTRITRIFATENKLKHLPNISGLTELKEINVRDNQLEQLPDLSHFPELEKLIIYNNELTEIPDVSNNKELLEIVAYGNKLERVPDFSNLEKLTFLEIGNNKLTHIPDMSNLPALEHFYCYLNDLEALPKFSNLSSLRVLNAGSNEIKASPDLSGMPIVRKVILDNNQLTEMPDISMLPELDSMDVYLNRLSFTELIKVKNHPYFHKFNIDPQRVFNVGRRVSAVEGQPTVLRTNIDRGLEGTTYEWYSEEGLFETTDNHLLRIDSTEANHDGVYYCKIYHESFEEVELRTDSFRVYVAPCLQAENMEFSIKGPKCNKTGEIITDLSSVEGYDLRFTLTSLTSGKEYTSESGAFYGLTEPSYNLRVYSESCHKEHKERLEVPVEKCREVILTPYGGGENESYWFEQTGSVKIYNKNGVVVKDLTVPGTWDGMGVSGLVSPGYYVADINNGEEFVNISVIY
ncbi:hypothetical protein RCC89_02430 [Cytophagaceae bacterium ABcell3]|nr:hypothetical protein RCC89_02430 [Cytophagaceae bacterium ABcell3]